jgi:fatty-acyl-CoA synthase
VMNAQAIASSDATRKWAKGAWTRALERTAPIPLNPSLTLPILVEELARRFGAGPALIDDAETLSYRQLAERANGYAHWALDHGITAGEAVCVFVPNCADYLALWLGITRVGGVAALINTNLVGASLVHAIDIISPRHVVVGATLADPFLAALPQIRSNIRCWAHGGEVLDFPRIDQEIRSYDGEARRLVRHFAPTLRSPALLVYTSGTTGLPKAANVSHFRILQWSYWFAGLMDAQPSDRMYDCLPMYHSVGGIVATGAMLVSGGSVVLRPRFSASRFWDEIAGWGCTLFQYIGELCRFLVQSPSHPLETAHRLRLCCGNGLRADMWPAFQQRFQIPRILEFYAATEGTFALYNCESEPGAIGRIPPFLPQRSHVALVRFDVESGMPIRGDDGFCIPCAADEIGEALGRLEGGRAAPGALFEGYTDPDATQRKILRDVFAPADAWFRTGDLMRKDGRGYFYFVDRIGDAFRWKGENVSSQQVAETLAGCPGIVEAIAYGVTVPGAEGRAGMAALVIDEAFSFDTLQRYLAERLPHYARPLFVRLCKTVEMTSTFKPRKQEVVRESYNPAATADPIFVEDSASRTFVRLDAELYARIQRNEIRF